MEAGELLAEVTLLLPILPLTFLLGRHKGQSNTSCIRRSSYPLVFSGLLTAPKYTCLLEEFVR